MEIRNLEAQVPFTTADGSTIRSILGFLCSCAPPYSHEDTYFE
jgi:hypothetical protein